jgi:hypothetical protein
LTVNFLFSGVMMFRLDFLSTYNFTSRYRTAATYVRSPLPAAPFYLGRPRATTEDFDILLMSREADYYFFFWRIAYY